MGSDPLLIFTIGSRSSSPYVALNRKLAYSAASAASQILILASFESLVPWSRAVSSLDQASSRALTSFSSKRRFASAESWDKPVGLFHGYALREIARIVRIVTLEHGQVIGEKL